MPKTSNHFKILPGFTPQDCVKDFVLQNIKTVYVGFYDNYSEKKSLFPKLKEEKNIELSKEELKNKKDTFLNEEEIVSSKKKVEETLSKYCTLYEKNSLKPLNIEYINKKKNRENLNNSTGPKWFNMKKQELTPEIKQDLNTMLIVNYRQRYSIRKIFFSFWIS